ncbi:coiled-coil domain-containing protein 1-like [Lucilia sericata]|uniref:coiled-coil domain-containing protein 1-like n=1 Tax=Lucilia sericata TaxID=13632 RepID=UPI0018A86989|nr:coiled-coil domain-containing protein 1-like [Lucilia sericata]
MRILLSSLLLLAGINLILARSIYWDADYNPNTWINDLEDELFAIPSNRYDDDFQKMWLGENSDESPEVLRTLHDIIEEFDNSKENGDDNDNVEEHIVDNNKDVNNDDNGNSEEILKSIQDLMDVLEKPEEHSEVEPFIIENGYESSEEKNDDDEEVTTMQGEILDLTKSSEEKSQDDVIDISEKDIEELAALMITLSAIDDLIEISNKTPQYGEETEDEFKSREVDEFLKLFTSILDEIIKEEHKTSSSNEDKDNNDNDNDDTTPKDDSNEENDDEDVTTPKPDSDEENDDDDEDVTTPETNSDEDNDYDITTPKNDSDEDNDDNNNDDTDDNSNSKENEIDSFDLTFHSIDDADQEQNLNDHKYEIVDPTVTQEIKPTSSPYTSTNFDDNNVIQEYVELRQNVDTEQDTLITNEHNLDKDFYNIISNNYNEESIKRFEKDFFLVRENLDRIKRNINAMENLSSKLYLHKLVNDAVKNVRK